MLAATCLCSMSRDSAPTVVPEKPSGTWGGGRQGSGDLWDLCAGTQVGWHDLQSGLLPGMDRREGRGVGKEGLRVYMQEWGYG